MAPITGFRRKFTVSGHLQFESGEVDCAVRNVRGLECNHRTPHPSACATQLRSAGPIALDTTHPAPSKPHNIAQKSVTNIMAAWPGCRVRASCAARLDSTRRLAALATHHLISSSFLIWRPSGLVSVKSNTMNRASSAGRLFTIAAKASLF